MVWLEHKLSSSSWNSTTGDGYWLKTACTRLPIGSAYLIGVGELELPGVPRPGDEGGAGLVGEKLQQELPQLDGSGTLFA
jgi:hypothetical protein